MKYLYLIFECDSHASLNSYCIKGFYTNKRKAIGDFKKLKKEFVKNNPDNWDLNLGLIHNSYLNVSKLDENTLRNISVIDSTEL